MWAITLFPRGSDQVIPHLLARGASINARPDYPPPGTLQVATATGTQRQALADWLREHRATEA